jgi:hypothetical protein
MALIDDAVASVPGETKCESEVRFTSHYQNLSNLQSSINSAVNIQTSEDSLELLDQFQYPLLNLSDICFDGELTPEDFSISFLDQIVQDDSSSTNNSTSAHVTDISSIALCASEFQLPSVQINTESYSLSSSILPTIQSHHQRFSGVTDNFSMTYSDQPSITATHYSINYDAHPCDSSKTYNSLHSSGYFSCLMDSIDNPSTENQPPPLCMSCTPASKCSADGVFKYSTKPEREYLVKPKESFIALVAKAIMSTVDYSMILSDIYQWILDNYPYYRTAKCAWQSSVRHSLSVNECFVKGKRAKNGRGFMWSIHPMCTDSFIKGDFDRRAARRIVQHSTRAITTAVQELEKLTQSVHANSNCGPPHPVREQYWSGSICQPISSTPIRSQTVGQYHSTNVYNNHGIGFSNTSRYAADCHGQDWSSPSNYGYV